MMKKFYKILTLCLALVMLLGIIPMSASADDAEERVYLVWTAEEYWDLSIPRPGSNTFLFVLTKPADDEKWNNCDDFGPYNGDMYEAIRLKYCDPSILSSSPGMKAAGLEAYNRISDPEYRATLVEMFGLSVKPETPVTPPAETTKPETPVTPPVTTTPPAATTTTPVTFSDVKPGSWYYEAVTEFAKTGLLAGYGDGTFHPNDPITGGQLATILCRIYGITDAELQEMRNTINAHPDSAWMKDAKGVVDISHWALPAMAIAYDCTCNVFESHMTNYQFNRGNVASALVAMARRSTWLSGTKPSYDDSDEAIKATVASIPDVTYNDPNAPDRTCGYGGDDPLYRDQWSSYYIGLAYQMGIMHGVDSTGRCDPWGKVTRAQLVQMLYNLGITHAGQLQPYRTSVETSKPGTDGVIIGGISSGAK